MVEKIRISSMNLRTIALAVALAAGFTASGEARQKPQNKVKIKHHKPAKHKNHKIKRYTA